MTIYWKARARKWTGATGRALRGNKDAMLIREYLICNEHANPIGLYRIPIGYIASDLGITIEDALNGLLACVDAGFCKYNSDTDCVFVINMAREQIGQNLKASTLEQGRRDPVTCHQIAVELAPMNSACTARRTVRLEQRLADVQFPCPDKGHFSALNILGRYIHAIRAKYPRSTVQNIVAVESQIRTLDLSRQARRGQTACNFRADRQYIPLGDPVHYLR